MAIRQKGEAFPPIATTTNTMRPDSNGDVAGARRRRKSSNLGGDPRGDTGAGGLATRHNEISNTVTTNQQQKPENQKRSKRRKAKGLFNRWKRLSLKHTWLSPMVLILALLACYYISPGEHNPLYPAIHLSYANPPLNERTNTLPAHIGDVMQYGKGKKDFAFVAFYIIVFTFTREFLMQRLILPIAKSYGIKSRAKQYRFMEQFYTAIYFAVFGPFGLWVMSRTPVWYFNTAGMYEGFPHRAHEGWFKAYYLLQASYWAQQAVVLMLQLEAPRKDFKELVLHHVVTLALIGLSYRFHFTYMGIAVYITHDISDFFLATSKVFNYLDFWWGPGYFAGFLFVWAYTRHYLNLRIIWSLLPNGQFATVGPYELNWDTQQYKCWISQAITAPLLAILQAVNIFWFVLIVRILVRYLVRGVAKDERSDDEEEEDEEIEGNGEATKPSLLVNGEPVSPVSPVGNGQAPATGVEVKGKEDVIRRQR